MRIACPSCGAEYEVPDRLLAGTARSLRCSRCGADFALPQAAPPSAAPPPAPEPPAAAAAEEPPPPAPAPAPAPSDRARAASAPPRQAALLRAWGASLVIVAAGVVAMLAFRSELMTAWPPAIRFFAALGLA